MWPDGEGTAKPPRRQVECWDGRIRGESAGWLEEFQGVSHVIGNRGDSTKVQGGLTSNWHIHEPAKNKLQLAENAGSCEEVSSGVYRLGVIRNSHISTKVGLRQPHPCVHLAPRLVPLLPMPRGQEFCNQKQGPLTPKCRSYTIGTRC